MSWQRSLVRPVPYTKPKRGEPRTLADARAYTIKRDPGTTDRAWQHTMKLMMEAAEEGDVEAVTKQLELALLIDGVMDSEGQLITVLGRKRRPNEKPPPACGRGFYRLTQFKPLGPLAASV